MTFKVSTVYIALSFLLGGIISCLFAGVIIYGYKIPEPLAIGTFYFGIASVVIGLIVFLAILIIKRGESVFNDDDIVRFGRKKVILFSFVVILILIGMLVSLFIVIRIALNGFSVGTVDVIRTVLVSSVVLGYLLPLTVALYIQLTVRTASGIVRLNIKYADFLLSLRRLIHRKKDQDEVNASITHEIFICNYVDKPSLGLMGVRILTGMAVSLSIGLFIYNIGTSLNPLPPITGFDQFFFAYLERIYVFLVIPTILSFPLFVWLNPSCWILDDAGVLFHRRDNWYRKPVDIESVARWFSLFLKGFFGISAILNYALLIVQSPITDMILHIPFDIRSPVFMTVFGFPLVATFCFYLMALTIHETQLTLFRDKLKKKLAERGIDITPKNVDLTVAP